MNIATLISFETQAAKQLFELVSSESQISNINKNSFLAIARYYDTRLGQVFYQAGAYEVYRNISKCYINKVIDEFCIRFYDTHIIVTKDIINTFLDTACANIIKIINN